MNHDPIDVSLYLIYNIYVKIFMDTKKATKLPIIKMRY